MKAGIGGDLRLPAEIGDSDGFKSVARASQNLLPLLDVCVRATQRPCRLCLVERVDAFLEALKSCCRQGLPRLVPEFTGACREHQQGTKEFTPRLIGLHGSLHTRWDGPSRVSSLKNCRCSRE